MCGKKEEDDHETGECSQGDIHHHHQNIQSYQEQLFLHHQQQLQQQQQYSIIDSYGGGGAGARSTGSGGGGGSGGRGGGGGGLIFPAEISPILPWSFPQVHALNPVQFSANLVREVHVNHHQNDPFLVPQPPPPPPPPLPPTTCSSSYGGLFNRRAASALQFAYDHHPSSSSDHHHHLRIISDHHHHQPAGSSHPFGLQAELGKMTAQEIMDAKALAASKSHSEAERRRRERINNHLAKLRSLLPSTTKTDKASLLAEVIQHVKELKRQTSQIAEASPVPTENDELTVDASDEDGKFIIKASLCCEDRSDLLPDLIKTLKALRLRTLKAEITTLGGRVKNVLFITGDHDHEQDDENDDQSTKMNYEHQHSLNSIQEALKAVMERSSSASSGDHDHQTTTTSSGSIKRQRTTTSTSNMIT